jgi:hypothetical protein
MSGRVAEVELEVVMSNNVVYDHNDVNDNFD